MKTWTIYALADPRTNEVRYVGRTSNLPRRLREHAHVYCKDATRKTCWLRELRAEGLQPSHLVLDGVAGEESADAERKWVAHFRAAGADLTNLNDGGAGSLGHVKSEETRRKLSEALRGRPRPPEVTRKAIATKLARGGYTQKQYDALRRTSQANIGRKRKKHAA